MITLSLDTASGICAVGVGDTQKNSDYCASSEHIGRGHSEILLERVDQCLKNSGYGYSNIERIVTTTGPGNFTGIRVGLSFARSLALTLGVPVVGITNLEACAAYGTQLSTVEGKEVCAILEAHRGEVYFQRFQDGMKISDPVVISISSLIENRDKWVTQDCVFCGSGVLPLQQKITEENLNWKINVVHELASAPIEIIAKLGERAEPPSIRPVAMYLRKPDAKPHSAIIGLTSDEVGLNPK